MRFLLAADDATHFEQIASWPVYFRYSGNGRHDERLKCLREKLLFIVLNFLVMPECP